MSLLVLETLSLTISGEVLFSWQAKVLDEDIESYELYLGSTQDQLLLKRGEILQNQTSEVLENNTVYYWQIVTIDENQNQSKSQVYSFQTQ